MRQLIRQHRACRAMLITWVFLASLAAGREASARAQHHPPDVRTVTFTH